MVDRWYCPAGDHEVGAIKLQDEESWWQALEVRGCLTHPLLCTSRALSLYSLLLIALSSTENDLEWLVAAVQHLRRRKHAVCGWKLPLLPDSQPHG